MKRGKRKKQKAKKGIHADKTAQHEVEEDIEALVKDNDTNSSSGTDIPISAIPVAIKPPSIANWKIIKLGKKGAYQIIREDGTYITYINFGAMLKSISRDDLTELYRLVMQRYGTNGLEDEYERVFWGDLKTIVHCLTLESADIYMLTERRYPLPADVCQAMLNKKLQGDKKDEACYQFCGAEFIINPEKDEFVPRVILGRSFLRLSQGVIDFGNGEITIYLEPDPFEDDSEKTGKSSDDWDQLLGFNFDDVPKTGEELPSFVCKMRKSNRNKKRAMEKLNLFYQNVGPSSSARRHLTQEEAAKEELAIKISQRYALLEEERPVIETMAYNDQYKKILDGIWKDKVELDGMTVKEDEEAVKRIKGEALKEKEDHSAFIFPIRLEGKVNENALGDTGSDINTMPYRIFETLGREYMKKIDKGITMINHTQAEAIGKLSNVLCQVILDIPIDRDAPIMVGRGFLHIMGSILNTSGRIFSTFDGICHQTFRAARFDVLRTAKSDSDDEEEYVIKRNKFGAPIYGPRPAPYLNCANPEDQSSAIQAVTNPFKKISVWKKAVSFLGSLPVPLKQTMGTNDDEAGSSQSKRSRHETVEEDVLNRMDCDGEIDDMLRIRVREAESEEEIFTLFDKVCAEDELQSKKIIKFRLGGRAHSFTLLEFARRLGLYQAVELEEDGFNVYFEGGLNSDDNFNVVDYWLSISREDNLGLMTGYDKVQKNDLWLLSMFDARHQNGDLDTTTFRDLIDYDGKLIPEDPQLGVPRDAIERMEYRQSYHWDRYQGVFEHMDGVYSVPLQGAYNLHGYAQPQYD
ncbi:hypothetical protein Tco_1539454 [Tanacetum coccineum]